MRFALCSLRSALCLLPLAFDPLALRPVMYESYFGFKKKPFNISPDPRFLYLSKKHREALAQLICGVREKKGFVVLSGEVGTGKTTILRSLLDRLDKNCQVAYIFNTRVSVVDFLKFVCHDFGLHVSGDSKVGYLIKLHNFLIKSHNNGKTTILIVDEAQNLYASLFEEIRMLTNLETSSQKLLQILLAGQPELNDLLDQSELWQLKQRISTRYHLLPLDRQETKEYIQTRMRIAGANRLNCFTEGSIQEIYRYSQGIPRLINNICDNSLLIGYATDAPIINKKIVRECVSDLRLQKNHKVPNEIKADSKVRSSFVIIFIGLLVAAIALSLFGKLSVPQSFSKPFETVQSLFQRSPRTEAKDAGLVKKVPIKTEQEARDPQPPDTAGVAENLAIRVAIAKQGDTLSHIILREFGRVDIHFLEAVKKLNPEIEDIDKIVAGQEIKLPSDPEEAYRNPGAPPRFSIHLASFQQFENANKLFNRLIEIGEKPTIIPANSNGSTWYRVTVGEYEDSAEASINAKTLVQSGQFGYAKPLKLPDL